MPQVFHILGVLTGAFIFAELAGWVVHNLLHSQHIEFLSRNHMIHHMRVYSPKMPQRPDRRYHKSTEERAELLGIGMEWVVPLAVVLLGVWGFAYMIGAGLFSTGLFTAAALSWGYFLFGYMHDSMHLKDFWMEKNRLTGRWYMKIRKFHDIHHMYVDDDGKMSVNYGICFFFFDRLFGSFKKEFRGFNHKGYEVAKVKYRYIDRQS